MGFVEWLRVEEGEIQGMMEDAVGKGVEEKEKARNVLYDRLKDMNAKIAMETYRLNTYEVRLGLETQRRLKKEVDKRLQRKGKFSFGVGKSKKSNGDGSNGNSGEAGRMKMEDGLTGDGVKKDGLTGDGVRNDGLTGDGVKKDGLTGDGVKKDGLTGDGVRNDGLTGDGVRKDGLTGDGVRNDGLTGDGMKKDGCGNAGQIGGVRVENIKEGADKPSDVGIPTYERIHGVDMKRIAVENRETMALVDVESSVVYIHGGESPSAIAGRNVEIPCLTGFYGKKIYNSTLVLDVPVEGSVHLEDMQHTTVYCKHARQVRIHNANDCVFYVQCQSGPIIENCKGLKFAPYQEDSTGDVGEHHMPSDQNEGQTRTTMAIRANRYVDSSSTDYCSTNSWDKVQDFGWIKRHIPSPNWSILPIEDRKPCMYS